MKRQDLVDMLAATEPDALMRLLPRLGYERSAATEDRGVLYLSSAGELLPIVPSQVRGDHGSSVLAVLEAVERPDLPLEDLVGMLALPESDIYRHKFDDGLSRWGAMSLVRCTEILPALLELLTYTAAGVWQPRRSYLRAPEPAADFGRRCFVGQTEHSSYVMKVFCPLRPPLATSNAGAGIGGPPAWTADAEPFGRLVTRACLDNLEFLSTDDADYPTPDAPPTLNRNVTEAVQMLRSTGLDSPAAASVWFAGIAGGPPTVSHVAISDSTFQRAQRWEQYFSPATGLERTSLKGYIVKLHKDNPARRYAVNQRITIDPVGGGLRRQLQVDLPADMYSQAVRWHDGNEMVRIDALWDTRRRPWAATEIFEFTSLESRQVRLFTAPVRVESAEPPPAAGRDVPLPPKVPGLPDWWADLNERRIELIDRELAAGGLSPAEAAEFAEIDRRLDEALDAVAPLPPLPSSGPTGRAGTVGG